MANPTAFGSPISRSGIGPGLLILTLLLAMATSTWLAWADHVERIVEVPSHAPSVPIGRVHFGGPDRPTGELRSLLLDRVRAAPAGTSIEWATYLFVDRELAEALMAASDRGVMVTLCLDGDPRLKRANDAVISLLRRHGLRNGLTVREPGWLPLSLVGRLHSKIYVFSHPRPVALVGSFNPAGGPSAGPEVLSGVGDQDRGHNILVEITSPGLVDALRNNIRSLSRNGGRLNPFEVDQNAIYRDGDTQLYFYPRLNTRIVEADVKRLGRGDRVWAAISHLGNAPVNALAAASNRGAKLNLIVHDSKVRVRQQAVDRLAAQGVRIRRYRHVNNLPMHSKFFLIQRGPERVSYIGSFNFNLASRRFNEEVLVRSTDPILFDALLHRFTQIEAEVRRQDAGRMRQAD